MCKDLLKKICRTYDRITSFRREWALRSDALPVAPYDLVELRKDPDVELPVYDLFRQHSEADPPYRAEYHVGVHRMFPEERLRIFQICTVCDDEFELVLPGQICQIGDPHPVLHT